MIFLILFEISIWYLAVSIIQGFTGFFAHRNKRTRCAEKHCSSEIEETVDVLEKHRWIIISDHNADHLKTREKKEVLCSVQCRAGRNWVKELFFTLFVTHKI